jgi:pimeloyl-ACP methyl ester carboxylesterase
MRWVRRLILIITSRCTAAPPPVVPPAGDEVTLFVHGIKGSFLVRDGPEGTERVWLSAGDLLTRGDRSLEVGGPCEPLRPDGILTRFTLFPLVARADVYLPWLELGAERLPGFVPFAYDWRLDAGLASRKLAARIDELAREKGARLRVNLVGHSLGGLIAVHALRHGGPGMKHVKKLVLAGAPFGGAPSFLRDIIEGDAVGRNRALLSAKAVQSMASAFQLLPWPGELPLAPAPAIAEARRRFREELLDGDPPDVKVLVVSGTGRPTLSTLDLDHGPLVPGDDRVPESATLPPKPFVVERLTTKADHVNLLNDEAVQEGIAKFLGGP